MKKILLGLVVFLLMTVSANAAPFLVCDPYPANEFQPTEFRITYGTTTVVSPAYKNSDGTVIIRVDLGPWSVGTYNLSVVAVLVDPIWGETVSTAVPFTFTKPASGTVGRPVNIRLSK